MKVRRIGIVLLVLFLSAYEGIQAQENKSFTSEIALKKESKAWGKVPGILRHIKEPTFKEQIFTVLSFGAIADGTTDCHAAFQKAIQTCTENGGGKVTVPAGTYLINGPIHLLNNVNLYLTKGALLKFGTNPGYYTPLVKVRWEGVVCYNYSPLIYAYKQKNIAITGSGTIDGGTEGSWSLWKSGNGGKNQDSDKVVLRQMGNDGVSENKRVFGNGKIGSDKSMPGYGDGKPHYLRPDMIQFYECQHILLDSLTLKSSPFWTVHPVFCKNVMIKNLTILKGTTNDDGIDPESSSNVLIEHCTISTNDDAISVKAGRDQDAWKRKGTKNIIIRNCILNSEIANAFCIGSEMSGGVKNVFFENCQSLKSENGINFKCNLDRGGYIKEVYLRNYDLNICSGNVILFQMDYHSWRGGHFPPDFSGFYLSDITCRKALDKSIHISGVADKHITKVFLNKVRIDMGLKAPEISYTDQVLMREVTINSIPVSPE
ncbi:Polygalacturonase [Arcticibacter svalbardensis MN12-7]|uniref:Polygalacturonase n=1 Tax=Arcticibacter svalbardensis MN12-7 TaxID=1150600 RepID=R9GUX4_9SPHI|nr:glycoside hydrolase family 28 protein [Arcticibacter svalbardensis]EOR95493.1 Polygalacturonase [Arcticibacter svalbardensis MN12-7]